ncbi:MAG: hypothetical protein OSB62_01660 [Alphaproteobacteria bacterium]|nr:hypothetical protein [Alphaproteobacteria bacterium]
MKYILSILGLSFMLISSAQACMGPMFEEKTFLHKYPNDMSTVKFAAKVELKENLNDSGLIQVQVIKIAKGQPVKQTFNVMYATHSCGGDHNLKAGEVHHIAGEFDANGTFKGAWKGVNFGHAQFTDEGRIDTPRVPIK